MEYVRQVQAGMMIPVKQESDDFSLSLSSESGRPEKRVREGSASAKQQEKRVRLTSSNEGSESSSTIQFLSLHV